MLKGINPLLSPELLKVLCEMGHGDEIVLADANFPGAACAKTLIRADGHSGTAILDAVLSVFPLDCVATENAILMATGDKAAPKPPIWEEYRAIMESYEAGNVKIAEIDRFDFYDRTRKAFAVIRRYLCRRTFRNCT